MTPRGWLILAGCTTASIAGLATVNRFVKLKYGQPPKRPATRPAPVNAIDVRMRAVDGGTLRGWFLQAQTERPSAGALVLHGWGGSAADMIPVAEVLVGMGLHVLALDARSHGRSDAAAVASMPSFAEDARTALIWMRTTPQVDPSRIALLGHSVGAGACLFVAAEDPDVAAVVSLASMADPRAFMAERMTHRLPGPLTALALRYIEHAIGHRYTEFAPVHTVKRVRRPMLLLHGEQDATVPVSDAYQLHALAPDRSTLVVLADGDHFNTDALDQAGPALTRFLKEAGLIGQYG